MSYAALFSGGKDSNLALWKGIRTGLDIGWLITVKPERDDSYMFHKPNLDLVPKIAESIGIELIEVETEGVKEEELEDLKSALRSIPVEGVVTGAVASNYQRERIEKMADVLELEVFSPLWNMDQYDLVEELLDEGFKSMIVSVAAMGLDDSWLGRMIDEECISDLKTLHDEYRINIAGEGGEYESLVLDGPMYEYGFEVIEGNKEWDGQRGVYDILKIEKK